MPRTPLTHALGAALYIGLVVSLINAFSSNTEDSALIPMVMLSLFVLSAAVMGYLFLYEPFHRYFEGKKEEAVSFFLKTVGYFAVIVAVFVAALLYSTI